jgi:hypothetical protein
MEVIFMLPKYYYSNKRSKRNKNRLISAVIFITLSILVSYLYIKTPSANVKNVVKTASFQTLDDTASIELTTLYSCGHTKTEIVKPSDNIKNKTMEEIERINPSWTIKQFTKNYIVVEETKDTQCENHYIIKLFNNKLQVYQGEKGMTKEVEIDVNLLTEDDKKILISGIAVNSEYELLEILESFQ